MPLTRKSSTMTEAAPKPSAHVLELLVGGTQEERWSAARAAAEIEGGARALAKALPLESNPQVRQAMFTSLTRIHSAESVSALAPLLRADDAGLRTGAVDALRAMAPVVQEHLPALLNDTDVDVRILSCELVRSLPSDVATDMLDSLLASETELNVCAAAVDVLSEVGNVSAIPTLEACANRFRDTPFMTFAIRVATDRILSDQARRTASATTDPTKVSHG